MMRYLAAAVLMFGLVACSSAKGSADPGSSSGTVTDAQILEIGKELAACIRKNGMPNFPDPTVQNGKLVLPPGQHQDAVQKALTPCKSIEDRLPQSAGDGDYSAQDIANLRKWAACLRQNGVPEWPDPKADGSFPIKGKPLDNEGKSERVRKAREACQVYWGQGWRVS
jgi:hypothetical protein